VSSFCSSLARAPHHQSYNRRCRSISHLHPTSIVSLYNDIHGDELADHLLFLEQLIAM
jgi:hypothetical protein